MKAVCVKFALGFSLSGFGFASFSGSAGRVPFCDASFRLCVFPEKTRLNDSIVAGLQLFRIDAALFVDTTDTLDRMNASQYTSMPSVNCLFIVKPGWLSKFTYENKSIKLSVPKCKDPIEILVDGTVIFPAGLFFVTKANETIGEVEGIIYFIKTLSNEKVDWNGNWIWFILLAIPVILVAMAGWYFSC